jgi:hypothetical protein
LPISILHISDAHFKHSNNSVFQKQSKFCDAVKNELDGISHLFILFTGDIANSGKSDEYDQAKIFIDMLTSMIKEYKTDLIIEIIFTAGNHDCDFSENQDIRNMIIDNIIKDSSSVTPTLIKKCVDIQQNYFKFISEFESTDKINEKVSNDLFRRFEYSINGIKIAFNSYNLAWSSKQKETQAELVYPTSFIDKESISNENYDLTIAMFHHPLHWIKHTSLRNFVEMINDTSNIVLTGHEHTHSASKRSKIDGAEHTEYIEAGSLQDLKDENESSFNFIMIDFEHKAHTITEFSWEGAMYIKKTDNSCDLPFTKKSQFRFKDHHKRSLNTMGIKVTHSGKKDEVFLEDLYVYPDLESVEGSSKKLSIFSEISSEKLTILANIKHTVIYGSDTSGKTALLQMLTMKYKNDGLLPIIINGRDIQKDDFELTKIKKLIQKQFKKQYEIGTTTIDVFDQTNKDDKILLIDDFDELCLNSDYKALFIQNLIQLNYQNILVFTHESLKIEATTESQLSKTLNKFMHFQLKEFGHILREKIIHNWVVLGNETTMEKKETHKITKHKASMITKTIGYNIVPAYPLYILTLLQAMESNETNILSKSTYGHYYYFLIMKYLNSEGNMTPNDLNTILTFTSDFAFKIFTNKDSVFTMGDFEKFNSDYIAKKKFTPSFSLTKKLIKSNIIIPFEDDFKFSYNYIYYYFVAMHFADNIDNPKVYEILEKMCKMLYVTEFANILMFIIHLTKKETIIDTILDEAKKIFSDIKQFTFELGELKNINASIKEETILKLKNHSTEEIRAMELEHNEQRDKTAKEQLANNDYHADADYDSTVKELNMFGKVNVALKMIDMLGEITKNYTGSLEGDIKINLIKETYIIGLKTIKALVGFFEENHEQITNELKTIIVKNGAMTQDNINISVSNMIFSISRIITTGAIRRVAKAVGSKDLKEIYEELLSVNKDNLAIQLITHAIKLDINQNVKIDEIEALHKKLKHESNKLTDSTLQSLVLEYIYMYDIDFSKKQSICKKLDIETSSSRSKMISVAK